MKTEKQIQDVLNLRSEKVSIRKIADRLNMSPTTVHKYIKIAPSVEEVQPALKIGTAEVTGDVTNNPNDID
ncbi:MAG: HTH domain-containing protein, partial [Thermoplasmatales archaeon]|nr:HTH domain-containing protein [Thermoplasmatales archaeon]